MTIRDYYNSKQPINDTVFRDIYSEQSTITMGNVANKRYARIFIAHVEENCWAFGWEICDSTIVNQRNCSPNNITKGCVNNLLYGVVKLLQIKADRMKASADMKKYLAAALQDANRYYVKDYNNTDKITF